MFIENFLKAGVILEKFHIRQFREADEAEVIRIWRECNLVVPLNNPETDIRLKMSFQPELFFVGELADRIVATIMAGYEGHRGWLNYLAVLPQYRNRGFGSAIVKHALARLRQTGCPKVNLNVRKSNLEVIKFYQKLGFKTDEVIGLGFRF